MSHDPWRIRSIVWLPAIILMLGIVGALLLPMFTRVRESCGPSPQGRCQSNLKQLGLGMLQYVQDNDDTFPVAWASHGRQDYTHHYSWRAMMEPYVKSTAIFCCPENPARYLAHEAGSPPSSPPGLVNGEGNSVPGSYGINTVHRWPGALDPIGWAGGMVPRPVKAAEVADPTRCILLGDVQTGSMHEITHLSNAPGFQRSDAGGKIHTGTANYCFADAHVKAMAPHKIPCTQAECWWAIQGKH